MTDWSARHAEVDFILGVPGEAALRFSGHVVQLRLSAEFDDFMFVGGAGMTVSLIPAMWPSSLIETWADVKVSLFVRARKGESGFTLTESFFKAKETPNLKEALGQLRTWQKLNVEVAVLLHQGQTGIFFLGNVVEVAPDSFSFVHVRKELQLVANINGYSNIRIDVIGMQTTVDMVTKDGESLVITDRKGDLEEMFKNIGSLSSRIQ